MNCRSVTHSLPLHDFLENTSQGTALKAAVRALIQAVSGPPQGDRARPRVYLVGGAIREILDQRPPHDFDLEVFGLSFEELEAGLVGTKVGSVHRCGRTFSILKWVIPEVGSEPVDVSVASTTCALEASRRRDFTVNSMMWDFDQRQLLDPWDGYGDLKKRRLRMVDAVRFAEDPLRVYRAAQFASRLGYHLDPECRQLCIELNQTGQLDNLPKERLHEEWRKLVVVSEQPSLGLQMLKEWGVLARHYPELDVLSSIPQDPRWHPEGDVWIHTLLVVDAAAWVARRDGLDSKASSIALFGALCHDLGKATTTIREADSELPQGFRVSAHGHEAAGVEPATCFLSKLCLGNQVDQAILECVSEHMRPGSLHKAWSRGELSPGQLRSAFRRLVKALPHCLIFEEAGFAAFMTVCEADKRGRGEEGLLSQQLWSKCDEAMLAERNALRSLACANTELLRPLWGDSGSLKSCSQTLLQGRDLLELGLKPGPLLGKLISTIERERDEGRIETREQAIEWVRQSELVAG